MRALVVGGPAQVAWRELPPPRPAANEALVKIEACGLCNSTDTELIDGTQPYRPAYPFVLGHESVGTVLSVGDQVVRYRVGDRVTRVAYILPGEQRDGLSSGWGGFAELGLVRDPGDPAAQPPQVVLPAELPPETAFLAISLAETRDFLEQIEAACGPVAGRTVAVVGTGIAGLTLCRWCREQGAARVIAIGRRDERLALARRSGADTAVTADRASAAPRADILFEAIGRPAELPRWADMLVDGGTIAIYGAAAAAAWQVAEAQLPPGLTVLRPGPREQRWVARIAARLVSGDIDPLLWRTHVWPADQAHEAFAAVRRGEVVKGCLVFG